MVLQETRVFVLCAGRQKRYGNHQSKMMFNVAHKPAFSYIMDSILNVFPANQVTIITSALFPELNKFITASYPRVQLVFDNDPGKGTALSFQKALSSWQSELAFITAGDIYYTPSLIKGMIRALIFQPEAKACLAVTPRVCIAPSHRPVTVEPFIIDNPSSSCRKPRHRLVGAYVVSPGAKKYFEGAATCIIEIFQNMQNFGELLFPYVYDGEYLHTAVTSDVELWHAILSAQKYQSCEENLLYP